MLEFGIFLIQREMLIWGFAVKKQQQCYSRPSSCLFTFCYRETFSWIFRSRMSFINFESGREKEKIREELREAREKLLAKVCWSRITF